MRSTEYDLATLDFERILGKADLVIVHEWNEPELVNRIGEYDARSKGFVLLFHDTHHRVVTDHPHMDQVRLSDYDGVLAFGRALADLYVRNGWVSRAWVWHEAADTRIFRPVSNAEKQGDLVWIGNGGDEERTGELVEYFVRPVQELGLQATVFGVRYPGGLLRALRQTGIEYGG